MSDDVIGVDEVAAHNLLRALGLEASDGRIAVAAAHMRAHRTSAGQFALEKACDDFFVHMENPFLRSRTHDEQWSAGCAVAENEALNWFAERPHADAPPSVRSKGHILRTMIRQQKADPRDGRH